jgi:hypothetical protein
MLALLVVSAVAGALWYRVEPAAQLPAYSARVEVAPAQAPEGLRAGFAAVDISPDVEAGGVWLAGFAPGREATGVHDPIWARAFVLDDGTASVGVVALDLIGHYYTDTIRVREAVRDLALDHVVVCSTHNHEGPDAIGMWGRFPMISGRGEAYMQSVREGAARALREAYATLRPATMVVAQAPSGTDDVRRPSGGEGREALFRGWIRDDRPPFVIDPTVTALRFDPPGAPAARGEGPDAIGTVVIWGNHPEALGDDNTALTSDYPHFVRARMEEGAGGICVFLVGAVGGLMSTLDVEVTLPDGTTTREAGFPQAEAIGRGVADVALRALEADAAETVRAPAIAARARTLTWPLSNRVFYLGAKLGVLDRGFIDGGIRSEVGVISVGPVELLLVPGEIYPELVVGGIENPQGADFPGAAPEGPPLYELAGGRYKAVVGLANDLVGYIIPRAEWDDAAPFNYGSANAWYGEINSTGPDAAAAIHGAMAELLTDGAEGGQDR